MSQLEQVAIVANEANLHAKEAEERTSHSEELLAEALQQLKSEQSTSALLASQLRRSEDDLATINATLSKTTLELREVKKEVEMERARAGDAERKLVDCVQDEGRKSMFRGWGLDVEKQKLDNGFVWGELHQLPTTPQDGSNCAKWVTPIAVLLGGMTAGYYLGGKVYDEPKCSSNV